jgi:PAS domain S-box-containing protein
MRAEREQLGDAAEALRESEARYRLLVENIPAVVYMVAPDDDRRTLYVSPQVERELGYTRKEWLDQPDIWMELLHPDEREQTLDAHDRHNETGDPWSREYRLIASDGRAVWFRDVATLVRDPDGRPQYWLGVQTDITELKRVEGDLRAARDELERRVQERTAALEEANELMALEIAERRRAEKELRAAEHRYRMLAEHIPAVTYVWESDPGETAPRAYTSPRIEQLLGYTVDEWHTTPDFWATRLHPDDRTAVLASTMRSETTGEPFSMEYRYLHKDGHIVWVLDEAVLLSRREDGRPDLFQGVMIDVTARKLAEEQAWRSEQRFRSLAEHAPAMTYVVDVTTGVPGGEVTYASPQLETMFGYTFDEVRFDWIDNVHPDDVDRVLAVAQRAAEMGEPYAIQYRVLHRDGTVRWVRDHGTVLSRDPSGRPTELQGLLIDITAAKRAEQERDQAEVRYRALVEQMPAVTYVEIPNFQADEVRFAYLSPQAERIFGRPVSDLVADPRHFARMLHPDDRDRVLRANAHAEETGEPFDEEFRVVRPDGKIVWLHSRATLVRDDEERAVFWHGVALDITAQRLTEQSLRELEDRYQKLQARTARSVPNRSADGALEAPQAGTGAGPSAARPSRPPADRSP